MSSLKVDPLRLGLSLREKGITLQTLRDDPVQVGTFQKTLGSQVFAELLQDWWFIGREEQLFPEGNWKWWLYMAGRGSGKTRAGAEFVKELIKQGYDRVGIIAPTAADARDVMVEGESGLLAISNTRDKDYQGHLIGRPHYEPSKRRLTWENGAKAITYSAEEPERLRGPQHSALWVDELAAWDRLETFDLALFGLRLGTRPRVFISTTPKPRPLIRQIYARALDKSDTDVVMTTGSSERNEQNLAPGVIADLRKSFGGSELARQELDGKLLEEVEGALWQKAWLQFAQPPKGLYVVVGVDPATSTKEKSDQTGIVVAGVFEGKGYVLADLTGKYSPAGWGSRVAEAYKAFGASAVVAEKNQGGDMVRYVLHAADPNMKVKLVHASKGKIARAEPVAQLYEQGHVYHAPGLEALEDEMVGWDRLAATYSPDRIDALVWALTELMVDNKKPVVTTHVKGMY